MPLLRSVVLAEAAALTLAHDELAKGKDVAKLKIDEIEAAHVGGQGALKREHIQQSVSAARASDAAETSPPTVQFV